MSEKLEGVCSLCGRELTAFGSKTIKDGILCRHCAEEISPWLTDDELLEKTVDDMKAHIMNRKRNAHKLMEFHPTKKAGKQFSILIDEDHQWFVVSKRGNLEEENPDVLKLDQIQKVSIESRKYPDAEDLEDVYMNVKVDGADFGAIDFRVNPFPGLSKDSDEYKQAMAEAEVLKSVLPSSGEEPLIEYTEADFYD